MKTCATLVIVGALFALQATAEIRTPPIDSVFNPGAQTTLVGVNDPEIGDGSTPDGVSVDQVFQVIPSGDNSPLIPVTVGAKDNEPDVSVGRKMLAGRKMLDNLALTGNGVSAGIDGVGVTTTLAGQGQSGVLEGEPTDSHIQPHQDTTTVTAGGKSITTGAGVNPDQLGGEGSEPLVYTVPGRK